jgi:hypothetical protein
MTKKTKKILPLLATALLGLQLSHGLLVGRASAASLTYTLVRFNRMKQSTGGAGDVFTDGTVCAKVPSTTPAETSVKVTFPTGTTVSTTAGDWAVSTATTTGWPSGAVAWPSIAAPTGSGEFVISGQSVNFVSGDLTSSASTYCFNWTNTTAALKTNTSAGASQTGQVITQTTGGVASDSGSFGTATIADDQVLVSATVPASFTFALSGNTTNFGTLSSGSVGSTSPNRTVTITTNAANGWIAWVKDSNQGLTSAAASKTIATAGTVDGTPSTLSAGTEGYVLDVDETTDPGTTVTVAAEYNGGANAGGTLSGTFQTAAVGTAPTGGDVLTLVGKAAIAGSTQAATDYTDTWTVIGAGAF